MLPSLASGDHVLTQPCEHARVGDIVVCRHPFVADSYVIKRVKEVGTEGLFLEGDNRTSSTDSNSFGVVPWSRLVAKVTSIL
jgi:nickel-type superoxide dismutase maturation protease